MRISIGQNSRDKLLMVNLLNLFKCGYITEDKRTHMTIFRVFNFEDIYSKIIPFFNKYKIERMKLLYFQDFSLTADLFNKKAHLSKEGFDKIKNIKSKMNRAKYQKKR